MNARVKLEKWQAAQKRYGLSNRHVQMARELGLNPDKLGKIDNHGQEPWKAPLPQHIENLYFKRFTRSEPSDIKSIGELLANEVAKKEHLKKAREQSRKQSPTLEESAPPADAEPYTEHLSVARKLKLYDKAQAIRPKLEAWDNCETILRKEAHIFDEAFALCGADNATLSRLGFVLKKIHPRYKPRRYGCKTLREIFDKLDGYHVARNDYGEVIVCRQ